MCLGLITQQSFSQAKEASVFDFGRMWTFENPPKEWFKEAYDFDPGDDWFDDVQKSSLRFASWCSASFVSPDGLIMTNHHCSRDEAIKAQIENENFDKNGFYATNLGDERKIEGLYVEQLIQTADITEDVLAAAKDANDDAEGQALKQAAIEKIKAEYGEKEGWQGLRLQVVNYYSGARFSIYGYTRYDDIRLVCIPENSIGFYGGDPDNFTYPRYNLDFTFWRAYDAVGNPINSSDNYLEFNPDGLENGTPVFVVGNPGRTERYRTVAELEYDRDYRYKMTLDFINNRIALLKEDYAELLKDPAKEREAQELYGTINNLANGSKAYTGIVKGLNDPDLFQRKIDMENKIRKSSPDLNHWDRLAELTNELKPHAWSVVNMSPSPYRGKGLDFIHQLAGYEDMLANDAEEADLADQRTALLDIAKVLGAPGEKKRLVTVFKELIAYIPAGNKVLNNLMGKIRPEVFVENAISNSVFTSDAAKAEKLMGKKKKFMKSDDPFLKMSRALIPEFQKGVAVYQKNTPEIQALEAKIANQAFNVLGDKLPPDATFTLRISDGVIKQYDYNGTTAPWKTTFFGMYDRHYSNEQAYPWDLPEKWQNPSMELLKSPVNIVSTNDIIGGNSGSPLINKAGEAVGLIFDGNIESLPGNFIFDEEFNRTVSVHAGGIYAALKYVYKADRLIEELTPSK